MKILTFKIETVNLKDEWLCDEGQKIQIEASLIKNINYMGSRKKTVFFSGPATKALPPSPFFSLKIAENGFWQQKNFPYFLGLNEPYLDVILYNCI